MMTALLVADRGIWIDPDLGRRHPGNLSPDFVANRRSPFELAMPVFRTYAGNQLLQRRSCPLSLQPVATGAMKLGVSIGSINQHIGINCEH